VCVPHSSWNLIILIKGPSLALTVVLPSKLEGHETSMERTRTLHINHPLLIIASKSSLQETGVQLLRDLEGQSGEEGEGKSGRD
jgi:hypothetical protein